MKSKMMIPARLRKYFTLFPCLFAARNAPSIAQLFTETQKSDLKAACDMHALI